MFKDKIVLIGSTLEKIVMLFPFAYRLTKKAEATLSTVWEFPPNVLPKLIQGNYLHQFPYWREEPPKIAFGKGQPFFELPNRKN